MTPTAKLRFVQRKEQLHPFYRSPDGGPAYRTLTILQQWWEHTEWNASGEWRDVPLETEDAPAT